MILFDVRSNLRMRDESGKAGLLAALIACSGLLTTALREPPFADLDGSTPIQSCLSSAPYVYSNGSTAGTITANKVVNSQWENPRSVVLVRDVLRRMKARCRRSRLVDSAGAPIVFVQAPPCQGINPSKEMIRRRAEEWSELPRKFHTSPAAIVTVASCPAGTPIP